MAINFVDLAGLTTWESSVTSCLHKLLESISMMHARKTSTEENIYVARETLRTFLARQFAQVKPRFQRLRRSLPVSVEAA